MNVLFKVKRHILALNAFKQSSLFDSSVNASFEFCTSNYLRQTVLKETIKCTKAWLLFKCPISFSGEKKSKIDINSYLIFYQNFKKYSYKINMTLFLGFFFSLINDEFLYVVCLLWACTCICKRPIKYGPE